MKVIIKRLTIFSVSLCITHAQSWISIGNHETTYARYYLGISNPNVSRNDAINNAISNALEGAGIEKSNINVESVRRTVSRSLSEQRIYNNDRSTFGQSKSFSEGEIERQFSFQIQNVKLMEEYFDGEIGYVLIRIPKQGHEMFDFLEWNEIESRKRKWSGLARSLAVPGWGQYYQQKKVRATLMLLGFLGSGILTGNSFTQYNKAIGNRNKSITAADKIRFYNESEKQKNLYYAGLGITGGFYLWSLLDTQLFPGEWKDYYYKNKVISPIIVRAQNKYARVFSISSHKDIPVRATINEAFDDKEISAINSSTITVNPFPFYGLNLPLSFFYSYSKPPSNYFNISELGFSFHYSEGQQPILGLYPSLSLQAGFIAVIQSWDGQDELINNYDMGYGFESMIASSENWATRVGIGFHRWFGRLDFSVQFGYQSQITFDNFSVSAYDGGTNKDGEKTTEEITIPPESLPYSSITLGGNYLSLGFSIGINPKKYTAKALIGDKNVQKN